jgi:hypothetical protein
LFFFVLLLFVLLPGRLRELGRHRHAYGDVASNAANAAASSFFGLSARGPRWFAGANACRHRGDALAG